MTDRGVVGVRRRRMGVVLAAVALSFLIIGLWPAQGAPSAPKGNPTPALAVAGTVAPTGPTPSAAAGAFFDSQAIPLPTVGNCVVSFGFTTCHNASTQPSVNTTSKGIVAVAYTAMTNSSACKNATLYGQSEIGFTNASAPGHAWRSPTYLGDTNCSDAAQYPSAWEPSLTSLGNGTLALTYIEYNSSITIPYIDCSVLQYDRVVFTRSFDNGKTWQPQVVINSTTNPTFKGGCPKGFPDQRPWITAFGQTLYLVWTNFTVPATGPVQRSQVHLVVSTDGGATWGPEITLRTFGTAHGAVGTNPVVATDSSGRVYVAYATNYTVIKTNPAEDVEVATSTNNGTSFSYAVAATNVPAVVLTNYEVASPVTLDPSPQLAWGGRYHQMFVTYAGGVVGSFCALPPPCFSPFTVASNVFVTNSSTFGATWSAPHAIDRGLVNGAVPNAPANLAYNPGAAVDAAGRLHVTFAFENNTICLPVAGAPSCGASEELYTNSSTNASSFSPPIIVNGNITPYVGSNYRYMWDGEYAGLTIAGGQPYLAYSAVSCPGWNSSAPSCDWGSNGIAQVTLSEPFTGAGITVSFAATGLPSSTPWWVSLLGVNQSGTGGSPIVFSGVPAGAPMSYLVDQIGAGYGTRYITFAGVFFLASWAKASTVTIAYTEQFLIHIGVTGLAAGDFPSSTSAAPTPRPGSFWTNATQPVSIGISNNTCTSCNLYSVSFLSWTGGGNGSYTGRSTNITLHPPGPLNETANFQLVGYCYVVTYGRPPVCQNYTYGLTFIEQGLPPNEPWSATIDGQGFSNSTPVISDPNATAGAHTFAVWTIPTATAGTEWVPNVTARSPVSIPGAGLVAVNFSKVSTSSATFPVLVTASGLPGSAAWSVNLSGVERGSTVPWLNLSTRGGSALTVNGSEVVGPNGTAYVVNSVTTTLGVENQSAPVSAPPPEKFVANGTAWVTLHYVVVDHLTVVSTAGGVAGPADLWVRPGTKVTLSETPARGYLFVGWSGPYSGNQSGPTLTISAPTQEVATFRPVPLPTWYALVETSGLPTGLNASFQLGSMRFSVPAGTAVTNLSSGWYPWTASPVEHPDGLSRYLPTTLSSSAGLAANGTLDLTSNVTLTITYSTVNRVDLGTTGNGTTSPSPGVSWLSNGATLALTASPDPGQELVGWSGTGAGSVNSSALSITVYAYGPVTEVASFAPRGPQPPATYLLNVTESGLPTGTGWSVSGAGSGASGTSGTLSVARLNGSYTVVAATIPGGPGIRFVPAAASYPVVVTADRALAVTYHAQYLVVIAAGSGGSAGPTTAWVDSGTSIALTASAASGYTFSGWAGNGSGSYTGVAASTNVTVTSPISEVASFASPTPAGSRPSGSGGLAVPSIAGVALAVIGAVALALAFVFRGRRPPAEPEPEASYGAYDDGATDPSLDVPPEGEGAPPPEWPEA